MIKKLAIWYLKKTSNYLWDVYNEGFQDGIQEIQTWIEWEAFLDE